MARQLRFLGNLGPGSMTLGTQRPDWELLGNPEQARLEGVTPSQKSSLEVGRWAGILTASSFL